MIEDTLVIDNFEKFSILNLSDIINWNTIETQKPYWVDFSKPPTTVSDIHSLLEIWCRNFWKDYIEQNCKETEFSGFEYWLHDYTGYDSLGHHEDKDEYSLKHFGETTYPYLGIVYYLHKEEPEGGVLEVQMPDGNQEEINAWPNRLVIFNSKYNHRVTPVTKGERKCLVSNLWITAPHEGNFK